MPIHPIQTAEDLRRLLPLLSASYGEPVALQDELDYFDAHRPAHWWYQTDARDRPIGFVRYFPVGKEPLVQLEYWSDDLELLDAFLEQLEADEVFGQALRWTVADERVDAIELRQRNFECRATYDRMVWSEPLLPGVKASVGAVHWAQATSQTLNAVQALFEEAFGPLDRARLQQQVDDRRLTVVRNAEGRIVGACRCGYQAEARELIQLAVHPAWRGRGYGRHLLEYTLRLHRRAQPELRFWLRVQTHNHPACQLYASVGFRQTAREAWWVRPFER